MTAAGVTPPGDATPPAPEGPPPGVRAMAVVRWGLVLITALVAVATIWHFAASPRAGVAETGGGAVARRYYCPMHPAVVLDHPGQCPICSMTLVPLPAAPDGTAVPPPSPASSGAPAGLAPIQLTPERIQLIGMKTAVVTREALGGDLRAVGVVEANERLQAEVNVRFSGWVQKLLVSATGERVRRGQVLATVYSPDVLRAEQELLVAHGWKAGPSSGAAADDHGPDLVAPGLEADARRRLQLLGIADQEIDAVVASGKPAEAIAIRSPVDGYVVAKAAQAGVAVQPGTVLFQVADLSTVWVTADVYEHDIARIHVGQQARFELTAYPGETTAGKVQFVYPTLDPGSRALKVRIELRNRFDRDGPRLRPGMSGIVRFALPATSGLLVPAQAVVDTGDERYLFVARPGGRFEPRAVKLGARLGDRVQVVGGLADGETVVTTGNFLIDSESRLRAAIQGQTAPGR